jgi:hypothetical protein
MERGNKPKPKLTTNQQIQALASALVARNNLAARLGMQFGGSSWVQMGTTQSLNIGYPAKAVITCFDHTVFTGANPVNIDNLYLSNKDYITHYPI